MIEFANWMFEKVSPLNGRKNPQLAAVLGFLFGGIGLGLYFLSFIDFLIPIVIAVLLGIVVPDLVDVNTGLGWLSGAVVASLWGYLRAADSNSKLDVSA